MEERPKSLVNPSVVIVYKRIGKFPTEKSIFFFEKIFFLPVQIEILSS